jgi:hypothetical protein
MITLVLIALLAGLMFSQRSKVYAKRADDAKKYLAWADAILAVFEQRDKAVERLNGAKNIYVPQRWRQFLSDLNSINYKACPLEFRGDWVKYLDRCRRMGAIEGLTGHDAGLEDATWTARAYCGPIYTPRLVCPPMGHGIE